MQEQDVPGGNDSSVEGERRMVSSPSTYTDCTGLSWHWQLVKSVSVEQLGLSFSLTSNGHTSQQQAELHGNVKNHCTGDIQSEGKNHITVSAPNWAKD